VVVTFGSNANKYINVLWWALGDDSTDDTAAITRACTCRQSSGDGIIDFSGRSYRIFGGTAGSPTIGAFTDLLKVITIKSGGAKLTNTRTFSGTDKGIIFSFTACKNIYIEPFTIDTTVALPATAGANKNFGFDFVWLYSNATNKGCYGVTIPAIKARGVRSVFAAYTAYNDPETYKSRSIDIGTIETDTCVYGVNLQFSGDDVRVGMIKSKAPHRSFFPYGISNFNVRVHSEGNDADDCLLACYDGAKLRNGYLEYYNREYSGCTKAASAAPGISFAFADLNPGVIDYRHIKTNQRWDDWGGVPAGDPAAGFHGIGVHLYKYNSGGSYDTVDRGHQWSNITIEGIFEGNPSGALGNSPPITSNGTWGTGEYIQDRKSVV
jgi:hypothetical protein